MSIAERVINRFSTYYQFTKKTLLPINRASRRRRQLLAQETLIVDLTAWYAGVYFMVRYYAILCPWYTWYAGVYFISDIMTMVCMVCRYVLLW